MLQRKGAITQISLGISVNGISGGCQRVPVNFPVLLQGG